MRVYSLRLLVFAAVFTASGAFAKRMAPAEIKPLLRGGIQYLTTVEPLKTTCPEKANGCGERVFLEATNKKSGAVVWKTELYQAVYDAGLETDVQTIRPKSLKFKSKSALEVVDEAKTRYAVNLKDGRLVQPKEVKVYSGP